MAKVEKKTKKPVRSRKGGRNKRKNAHWYQSLPVLPWQIWWRSSYQLAAVVALAGLVYGGWLRYHNPDFMPLKVISIPQKLKHVNSQHLRQQVDAVARGNWLTVNVAQIRETVQALPWVASVSIRRVWPDKLELHLQEQRAVAVWGKSRVLNNHGELFSPAQWPTGLPHLLGPKGFSTQVFEQYQSMLQQLQEQGLSISQLQLNERGGWQVTLNNQVLLILGKVDVNHRLARFLRNLTRLGKGEGEVLKQVDLRYTNGFAVRWGSV